MMELILQNKYVDVQVITHEGVNAFWIACFYGYGHIMKLLAEHNIRVFSCNEDKVTALHLAVIRDFPQIVEMLLKSGFPIDLQTTNGMTALNLAAHLGRKEITDILLSFLKSNSNLK